MRTSKPIATISYNTVEFLKMRLDELMKSHQISDYMFIQHQAEEDEAKDHIHLWIQPNRLLDTMDLQDYLKEIDLGDPTKKPLGCIDFRASKPDDWILYCQHFKPYLMSKGEEREYHYLKEDFVYADEDNFENKYKHAFKGSDWAKRYQTLEILKEGSISPAEMIYSGILPLQMASQLNALEHLKRNGRPTHTPRDENWEKLKKSMTGENEL